MYYAKLKKPPPKDAFQFDEKEWDKRLDRWESVCKEFDNGDLDVPELAMLKMMTFDESSTIEQASDDDMW
jgi:hypothetical protein